MTAEVLHRFRVDSKQSEFKRERLPQSEKYLAKALVFSKTYEIRHTFRYDSDQLELFQFRFAKAHISSNQERNKINEYIRQIEQRITSKHESLGTGRIDLEYFSPDAIKHAAKKLAAADSISGKKKRERKITETIAELEKPRLEELHKVRQILTRPEKRTSDEEIALAQEALKDAKHREIKNEDEIREAQQRLDTIYTPWNRLQIPQKENGEVYSAVELTDAVKESLKSFIRDRLPEFRQLTQLSEIKLDKQKNLDNLLDALSSGWFESIGADGKRSELLLVEAAHMTKRIEYSLYNNFFQSASEEQLASLGLNTAAKDLLLKLMKISIKADPLFVRFLAYTQGMDENIRQKSSETGFSFPGDTTRYATASVFPKESGFIARELTSLAADDSAWAGLPPGSEYFREYLKILSQFYSEKNPKAAKILLRGQKNQRDGSLVALYKQAAESGFPLVLIPPLEAHEDSRLLDPEMRVCLAIGEKDTETQLFTLAQQGMADVLSDELEQFKDAVRNRKIVKVVNIGAYGINLKFDAVAYEDPTVVLVLDEQIRALDVYFPKVLEQFADTDRIFGGNTEQRKANMEFFSRMMTVLHEGAHGIYPDKDSVENRRFGEKGYVNFNDIKVEVLFRSFLRDLIHSEAILGNEEQWAVASLGSALQTVADYDLDDQDSFDEYYYAGAYVLKQAFSGNAVVIDENKKLKITDYDAYYRNMESAGLTIRSIFMNPDMNPKDAQKWVTDNCIFDSEKDKKIIKAVKRVAKAIS